MIEMRSIGTRPPTKAARGHAPWPAGPRLRALTGRSRLLWGLAFLLLSTPALGAPGPRAGSPLLGMDDPAPTAQEKLEARALFKKGLAAFAAQRYPDALAHFNASNRLVPKSVVLYNIAMCHRALFEYSKAIVVFEDYLKQRGMRLPLMKRREVERFIKEMRGKLGHLRLAVEPDGAEVRVDGLRVGRTPLSEPMAIDPGHRVVLISHPEHLPTTLNVNVVSGQLHSKTVRLKQAPRDGRLVITCPVPRCRVQVDGGAPQALPVSLSVPAGDRQLRVEAPGHLAQVLTVPVTGGKTVTRDVLLVADASGPGPGGTEPVPLVRKWWFWTVLSVGLAAVAGTTTGLVLWDQSRTRSNPDFTWRLP